MVFLHGWGGSRESLRELARLFEHTHQVHLLDLPGFGASPIPPEGWGTQEYAALVESYLSARLSGRAILVGHSFGGRIGVRIAGRRVVPIRALALIGVPGLPASPWTRGALRRRGVRLLRACLRLVAPVTGSGPLAWHSRRFGSRDFQAAGDLRGVLVRTVAEDLTPLVTAIECPVLLLYGSADTETPPWLARRYAALLGARATCHVLPHKDHFPFTGTGAHLCGALLRRWLVACGG